MRFPNEEPIEARFALLASTFAHRLGPMLIVAALCIKEDAPVGSVFGGVVLAWIAFEVLVKLRVEHDKRKRASRAQGADAS